MSASRHSGTSSTSLRSMGMPRRLTVRVDATGTPVAITRIARGHAAEAHVEQIDEVWRVAEAWWREAPQTRTYYRVILDGGRPLTLFRDEVSGAWYEQPYPAAAQR